MRRLRHWMLALAVVVAWTSGDSPRLAVLHALAGHAVVVLLVITAIGLVRERRWPGPTRIAGWSTLTGLALVLVLAVTGAVVLGGEEGQGPLRGIVPVGTGIAVHEVHEVAAWALLAWIGVHVAGALRHWSSERPVARVEALGIAGAVLAGLGLAGAFTAQARWGPGLSPFETPALADDATWRRECGDCHLAFHPSLLPARSWDRMMDEQADHFDEDLGLDDATAASIRAFLVANAADLGATEHAWRIARSVPAGEAPQQISELAWWERVHADVPAEAFDHPDVRGRVRCDACHADADAGAMQGGFVALP